MTKTATELIEIYERGLFKILADYKTEFNKGASAFIEMVAKFDSVRGCLLLLYQMLVNKNMLTKIEDLSIEDKTGIWKMAKSYGENHEKEYLTQLSKALHVLGSSI